MAIDFVQLITKSQQFNFINQLILKNQKTRGGALFPLFLFLSCFFSQPEFLAFFRPFKNSFFPQWMSSFIFYHYMQVKNLLCVSLTSKLKVLLHIFNTRVGWSFPCAWSTLKHILLLTGLS